MQTNSILCAFNSQIARIISKAETVSALASKQKDCAVIFKNVERICDVLETEKVISSEQITGINPQKGVLRLARSLNFIVTGDASRYDASTGLLLSACLLSKQGLISYKDIQYVSGGKGDNDTQSISGVARERLKAICGNVSAQTIQTRCSSALGASGFLVHLGVAKKAGNNGIEIVKHQKSLNYALAFSRRLEVMSDRDFITEILSK